MLEQTISEEIGEVMIQHQILYLHLASYIHTHVYQTSKALPHGIVYSSFMACVIIGSVIYQHLFEKQHQSEVTNICFHNILQHQGLIYDA